MNCDQWLHRDMLAAPFTLPYAVKDLGRSLWLYLWLVLRANRLGLVCRTQCSLGSDLGSDEACLSDWLKRLEAASLITIEHPAPYLVIKLRFWPGIDTDSLDFRAAMPRAEAPGSKLLPEQQPEAAPAAGVDGGAGEGEGLLGEAERILGPGHEVELAEVVSHHGAALVRDSLRRVEKTPPSQIRKSRYALFRYLLIRLSHASHDGHAPNHPPV